jgi:hypothetical protein
MSKSNGLWRNNPAQPGFSKELIAAEFDKVKDKTTEDKLEIYPEPGVETLFKAFKNNVKRIPDNEMFGTRIGDEYQWMTFK